MKETVEHYRNDDAYSQTNTQTNRCKRSSIFCANDLIQITYRILFGRTKTSIRIQATSGIPFNREQSMLREIQRLHHKGPSNIDH